MRCSIARKSTTLVLAALLYGIALVAGAGAPNKLPGAQQIPQVQQALENARFPFIQNEGETADEVRFYARTSAGTVFVTRTSQLVYALPGRHGGAAGSSGTWTFRESLVGARPMHPRGVRQSLVRVSVFRGEDPRGWRDDLPAFSHLSLGLPYPGVELTLRAAGDSVEKLFTIAPGSDPSAIDMRVEGVDQLAVDPHGQLLLGTSLGDIVFTAPVAYQVIDGIRHLVAVAYRIEDGRRYGFDVGAYDQGHELVIDPVLASTYIGGQNPSPPGNYDDDHILGMVVSGGDVWIAGATQSPDFPIHLGYDSTLDSSSPDGFIARLSGDLSHVIASTYLGTAGFDRVTDIALDDGGSIVVVGQAGFGFPVTPGAYTWSGGTPVGGGFVARLSADLSTLEASAVVTPSDYPRRLALAGDSILFGGSTNDPGFPITAGAYQTTCCAVGSFGIREYDGFAGKISADLATLEAMTYLGGRSVSGIDVAADGTVYISDGFDQAVTGSLSRFDADLTARLAFLSYYPGSSSGSSRTYFNDVVAGDGVVVAAGQTFMNDLPATPGAYDTTCGTDGLCDGVGSLLVPRSDGFVAVYVPDLQQTLALTYLGGSGQESIRALELSADGEILITGETSSIDLPTAGEGTDTRCGLDGSCGSIPGSSTTPTDAFVARLAADLSRLEYATYLGGSGSERARAIGLSTFGRAYVAGFTDSLDLPTTPGAFDPTYNGGTSDGFIAYLDLGAGSAVIFADDFDRGDASFWTARTP